MALAVTYTTVNGQIIHENRGGVERFYIPDPLGNTAALVDTSGNITDTWTYWPYGEIEDHGDGHGGAGTAETPFTSAGTWGCYTDATALIYARSRELDVVLTNWLTVDRLWPAQRPYGSSRSMPTLVVDPSGMVPAKPVHRTAAPVGYAPLSFPRTCSKTYKPCWEYLIPIGQGNSDNAKQLLDILTCIQSLGEEPTGQDIATCLRYPTGRGISKNVLRAFMAYLACVEASQFTAGMGTANHKDPCSNTAIPEMCDACAYEHYLKCAADCAINNSGGLAISECLAGCIAIYYRDSADCADKY